MPDNNIQVKALEGKMQRFHLRSAKEYDVADTIFTQQLPYLQQHRNTE